MPPLFSKLAKLSAFMRPKTPVPTDTGKSDVTKKPVVMPQISFSHQDTVDFTPTGNGATPTPPMMTGLSAIKLGPNDKLTKSPKGFYVAVGSRGSQPLPPGTKWESFKEWLKVNESKSVGAPLKTAVGQGRTCFLCKRAPATKKDDNGFFCDRCAGDMGYSM